MKTNMYCVFDRKTTLYHIPFHAHNTGHAMRIFQGMCQDSQSQVQTWPEDFELFEIGTFTDETGALESLPKPHFIINATSVLEGTDTGKKKAKELLDGIVFEPDKKV